MIADLEISTSIKEQIVQRVESILNSRFVGERRQMNVYVDRLNFACPYCGDSHDAHKKRGNIYWQNMTYHCFNGGCSVVHCDVVKFLKDNGQPIKDMNDLMYCLDFIQTHKTEISHSDYFDFHVFVKLRDYSIPIETIKSKLKLKSVIENSHIREYLRSRLMSSQLDKFLYDPKKDQLYILNLTNDNRVIGWQIRNFDENKPKYVSYNIQKITELIHKKQIDIDSNTLSRINSLSIYFGILSVDFTKKFTVFEGPIDSFLFPNSIAITGVNKRTDMFDEFPLCRYLFDNDDSGRSEMELKLKKKRTVFMWKKLLYDFKINVNIKDFNDLFIYAKSINSKEIIQSINNYFTNDRLDYRWI